MNVKHYRRFLILPTMLLAATFVSAQNNVPLDTIPFEIGADNRIYVETIVNNDTTRIYRFLVDTGASSCILNSNIESLMTLVRFKETAKNIGATSVEDDIPMTSPTQTLQIGHNAVTGLEFVAIPYPVDAWDGVIGLSFLMNFEVALDYNRWEMYLYKKGAIDLDLGLSVGAHYVSYSQNSGLAVLPYPELRVALTWRKTSVSEKYRGSDPLKDLYKREKESIDISFNATTRESFDAILQQKLKPGQSSILKDLYEGDRWAYLADYKEFFRESFTDLATAGVERSSLDQKHKDKLIKYIQRLEKKALDAFEKEIKAEEN